MARRDGIAALVMLLGAGAVVWEAAKLPFGVVRNPGPGFVPWWVALVLAALSALLGVQALRARPSGPPARSAERRQWGRVAGLLVALGVYVAALSPLGYPIATFLLVLLMLRPMLRRRPGSALGLAALAAGGSYLLFAVWLSVPLPPGPWRY
ncbi:MAG: tripartite tricarboxylate transporter TctB family protein [Candidatus Rokubacteria bacterium]|nr:tripartite tricarboxylate transporter TctB family protein [Candidatus Rokubacteria bacterium]